MSTEKQTESPRASDPAVGSSDLVSCPRCNGQGSVTYTVAGEPRKFAEYPGVKFPTSRDITSICSGCMGSKQVHPLKARLIEAETARAYQRYLNS